MRHYLLGLCFVSASVGGAPSDTRNQTEQILLEPVSAISFCGEIPTRIGDKITTDVSSLSFCFNAKDKTNREYACRVPINTTPLWRSVEDAFAEGQKYKGGRIGDILVPANRCQELKNE